MNLRPIPPARGYRVILADPPWRFDLYNEATGGAKSPQAHYSCMGPADLIAFGRDIGLERPGFVAPSCALLLWVTFPIAARGDHGPLMQAWGFQPKTGGAWIKQTRTGKLGFGPGLIFRSTAEVWFLGTRGRPIRGSRSERNGYLEQQNGIVSEARGHSVKPPELHAQLERLYPCGPYLELFARRQRPGWDCYGDELGGFVGAEELAA
jgi:N6-adenosine-specific RNA methylase IME4